MNEKKVYLAFCNYGQKVEHHHCMQLIATANLWAKVEMASDYHTPRGRSILANHFLASDCTHMLFVDPDLMWRPEHAQRILSHNVTIVAGVYAEKSERRHWLCKGMPGHEQRPDGLLRATGLATGFMLLSREALESVRPLLRTWDDEKDGLCHEFFWCGALDGKYWTEDYWFCNQAYKAGVEMYADLHCTIGHQGVAVYPLKALEEKPEDFPFGTRLDIPGVVDMLPKAKKPRLKRVKAEYVYEGVLPEFPFTNICHLWEVYLSMRKDKKCKPLLRQSLMVQFAKFRAAGEAETKRALEASIANGWQGVFLKEPEAKMEGLKL